MFEKFSMLYEKMHLVAFCAMFSQLKFYKFSEHDEVHN